MRRNRAVDAYVLQEYLVFFFFWRLAYNCGLGSLLYWQSQHDIMTRWMRGVMGAPASSLLRRLIRHALITKMDADYDFEARARIDFVWRPAAAPSHGPWSCGGCGRRCRLHSTPGLYFANWSTWCSQMMLWPTSGCASSISNGVRRPPAARCVHRLRMHRPRTRHACRPPFSRGCRGGPMEGVRGTDARDAAV